MTPLINPWFFYFLEIADRLNCLAFCSAVVLVITLVLLFLLHENPNPFDNEEHIKKEKEHFKKVIKYFIIATFISICLAIFIPTKPTLIQMYAANYITENNITKFENHADKLIDYVIQKSEMLEKAKKEVQK